jgi:RNA polymerase sigma-70 factor (ECF subfamily)
MLVEKFRWRVIILGLRLILLLENRMPSPKEVTELLLAWSEGDRSALEQLIPLVYDELHKMARRYMVREQVAHTLQTTALVNEAYIRMIDMRKVQWQNRAHFFAVSAQLMRRILVDFARSRNYQKRGGGRRLVTLDDALEVSPKQDADLVLLDEALDALAVVDDRKRRVVELRFFGGLTVDETAHVLEVSPDTVMRDWKMAKVWLLREMSGEGRDEA